MSCVNLGLWFQFPNGPITINHGSSKCRSSKRAFVSSKNWVSLAVSCHKRKPTSSPSEAGQPRFPPFDLESYMSERVNFINKELDDAVSLKHPLKIHEAMRYSLLAGGKRIRPLLCMAAFEVVGGGHYSSSALARVACALEMIQTMTLIHDDLPCVDNDDLRRGKPSNHKVFGQPVALYAGSALHALAFEQIALAHGVSSTTNILSCIVELARAIGAEGVAAGQVVDVESEGAHGDNIVRLEFIHVHKSTKLLEAALVMGAVLGGGTEEEVESLREYGRCVGLLYQVVDDVLDVTKSTSELGKTAGKDLVVDKLTYPRVLGIHKSREFAEDLKREAKLHLGVFDQEKAAPLDALADYIAYKHN